MIRVLKCKGKFEQKKKENILKTTRTTVSYSGVLFNLFNI